MARTRVLFDDGVLSITDMKAVAGLRLSGEIDESNYGALVKALDRFAGSAEVHLDLSGLRYCEVACLRAMIPLVCSARRDGQAQPQVVLHAVPSYLKTTLRILGWNELPGLSVRDDAHQ